jgi:hypothetical protein
LIQRSSYNAGEAASGTPNNIWTDQYNLTGTSDVTVYGSCVTPASAVGLAPVKPSKPTITVKKLS